MGCWNETCGISNLTIHAGNDVVLIPIIEVGHRGRDSYCYISDRHVPYALPIFGKYNDYGSIENIESNELNNITLEYYQKNIENESFYYNEWASWKGKSETLKDIIDTIERGILHKQAFDGEELKFNLFFVHRKIYDNLVNELKNTVPYSETNTIYELYIESYNYLKTLKNDPYGFRGDETAFMRALTFDKNKRMFKQYIKNDVSDDSLKIMIDFILFNTAMSLLRKGWRPQCGKGGQDNEQILHLKLCEFIKEQINDQVEKYQETTLDELKPESETLFWYGDRD